MTFRSQRLYLVAIASLLVSGCVNVWWRCHDTTSSDEMQTCAKHSYFKARAGLARNDNATPEVLRELAIDPELVVREGVAENRNMPEDLFPILSGDSDSFVREAIARSPRAQGQVLRKLADDPDLLVRVYVYKNPATPSDVRERLRKDPKVIAEEDRIEREGSMGSSARSGGSYQPPTYTQPKPSYTPPSPVSPPMCTGHGVGCN